MDLKGIGWECVESIQLAQDRDSVLLQRGCNQFSFTKCGVFLDLHRNYWPLKKDSGQCS